MTASRILPVALALLLPLAAHAGDDTGIGIGAEIQRDLADARKEVRAELAQARRELETENLRIDDGLRFGDAGKTRADLPRAEITPAGDFLIEGKVQAIDPAQREELLAYRGLVIGIARNGIDIGERSAEAALDAVDGSWLGLVFSAMTGGLERRVERTVRAGIKPAVLDICRQLPAVMASQQRLAASLPPFQPYATLEADDVEDCEREVRNEFASR